MSLIALSVWLQQCFGLGQLFFYYIFVGCFTGGFPKNLLKVFWAESNPLRDRLDRQVAVEVLVDIADRFLD